MSTTGVCSGWRGWRLEVKTRTGTLGTERKSPATPRRRHRRRLARAGAHRPGCGGSSPNWLRWTRRATTRTCSARHGRWSRSGAGLKADPSPTGARAWTGCALRNGFLSVELALLEDHGLTLPPETYPLKGLDRSAQVNRRRKALEDTQEARKRSELLRRIGRAVHPGPVAAVATGDGPGLAVSVNFM